MASLKCPYCRHTMNLKSAKPGQYKPNCPGCKRAFALSVPTDPAAVPVVTALPSDLDEATLAESQPPADERTLAHDGSPAPDW